MRWINGPSVAFVEVSGPLGTAVAHWHWPPRRIGTIFLKAVGHRAEPSSTNPPPAPNYFSLSQYTVVSSFVIPQGRDFFAVEITDLLVHRVPIMSRHDLDVNPKVRFTHVFRDDLQLTRVAEQASSEGPASVVRLPPLLSTFCRG